MAGLARYFAAIDRRPPSTCITVVIVAECDARRSEVLSEDSGIAFCRGRRDGGEGNRLSPQTQQALRAPAFLASVAAIGVLIITLGAAKEWVGEVLWPSLRDQPAEQDGSPNRFVHAASEEI